MTGPMVSVRRYAHSCMIGWRRSKKSIVTYAALRPDWSSTAWNGWSGLASLLAHVRQRFLHTRVGLYGMAGDRHCVPT